MKHINIIVDKKGMPPLFNGGFEIKAYHFNHHVWRAYSEGLEHLWQACSRRSTWRGSRCLMRNKPMSFFFSWSFCHLVKVIQIPKAGEHLSKTSSFIPCFPLRHQTSTTELNSHWTLNEFEFFMCGTRVVTTYKNKQHNTFPLFGTIRTGFVDFEPYE